MDNNKALKILLEVAKGATYESEYDGICDTYCAYCDANLSRAKHHDDCLMFLARDAARDEIAAIEAEEEKRRRAEYMKTWDYKVELIACKNCGKKVKRIGLENHVRDSGCKLQRNQKEEARND